MLNQNHNSFGRLLYRLPTISEPDIFGKRHFGTDILACACFGLADIAVHGHFVFMDVSTQGLFDRETFWHKEFLAPWTFGHRIFWYLNILAYGYFPTWQSNMNISAQKFVHLCYSAEMFMCRNVSTTKCPRAKMSMVPKDP